MLNNTLLNKLSFKCLVDALTNSLNSVKSSYEIQELFYRKYKRTIPINTLSVILKATLSIKPANSRRLYGNIAAIKKMEKLIKTYNIKYTRNNLEK